MKYRYFISYWVTTEDGMGVCNATLGLTNKIKSTDIIRQIELELKSAQDIYKNVAIISWKYLGRNK